MCVGGTEGHPKERPGESKRGGHPGHTDKTRERGREREGGRVGGTEMKGEREDMRHWLGVHLSIFAGYGYEL